MIWELKWNKNEKQQLMDAFTEDAVGIAELNNRMLEALQEAFDASQRRIGTGPLPFPSPLQNQQEGPRTGLPQLR